MTKPLNTKVIYSQLRSIHSQGVFLQCGDAALEKHLMCLGTGSHSELLKSEEKRASLVTQQHFQRLPSVKNKRAGGRPTPSCSELPPVSTTRLSAVVWGNWSSPPAPQTPSTGHFSQKCYRKHTLFIPLINTVTVLLLSEVTRCLGCLSRPFYK